MACPAHRVELTVKFLLAELHDARGGARQLRPDSVRGRTRGPRLRTMALIDGNDLLTGGLLWYSEEARTHLSRRSGVPQLEVVY